MIYKIFMGKSLSFLMFCIEKVLTDNVVGKFLLLSCLYTVKIELVYGVLRITLDQVCPGSSTPRGEKPETRETNHNMETDLHASSVSNGECLQD